MADSNNRNPAARRQPNRLQRRAPASLQIGPATEWKEAIPLLSPLILSPVSDNPTAEIRSCAGKGTASVAAEKPAVVMKKWQHPAAPFGYDTAPFGYDTAPFTPFVHTGFSDR